MTPDHFFIDSQGERHGEMEEGWRVYLDTPENRGKIGFE